MATNTFDRPIRITSPESLEKLIQIMESEPSKKPFTAHPFTDNDRKKGEELAKICLSNSKH